MDSVSQFALGASVAALVLGSRVGAGRAVLLGGLVATLPDLDVLFDHGDPIADMTRHRAESHALFWLTAATPLLAWLVTRARDERRHFGRWCLAVWLVLVTHVALDALTIYGTQLLLPFTDRAFGVGCLFVIDPLYTLPLLAGLAVLLWHRGQDPGRRANLVGLALSTLYAGWSLFAQQHVSAIARDELRRQGIVAERVLATPSPLQTVLWRIVVVQDGHWLEGHWSWFDADRRIAFERFDRGAALEAQLGDVPGVARLVEWSGGFCRFTEDADGIAVADLRMGQSPHFAFDFRVAQRDAEGVVRPLPVAAKIGRRLEAGAAFAWLLRRAAGQRIAAPR